MVPSSKKVQVNHGVERAIRSFSRSRWPMVTQGVLLGVAAIGATSMMFNVITHVIQN